MFRVHKVAQALGKGKIVYPAVTQSQLLHPLYGDRLRDPGSNIQDQKFDLQFVMNE